MKTNNRREAGFTVLVTAVSAVCIFGMAGLAVDVGRMYITKNEAQSYADSAALYAAQQLNGTSAGLTAADSAAANVPMKWGFGTAAFSGTVVEYSADGSTGWAASASVANPATISYVRVTSSVTNLPLYLLPVTGTSNTATVKAQAVAGQTLEGTSAANPLKNDVFPYSPIANVDATNSSQLPTTGDPFGYTVGQQYDLKWPTNPQIGTAGNPTIPCAGDDNQAMINREAPSGSAWGSVTYNSAESLYQSITDDSGSVNLYVNQSVNPTTGDKNSEATAYDQRVAQDGDTTSTTISDYLANPAHNGRRIITVMVNSGFANAAGVAYPASEQAIGLGYAQFLLVPSYSKSGGANNAWCAIYMGPGGGADSTSGGSSGNSSGVGVIRLVQ